MNLNKEKIAKLNEEISLLKQEPCDTSYQMIYEKELEIKMISISCLQ